MASPPRGKLMGVEFVVLVVAEGCRTVAGCGCLQRTAAAGARSVQHGIALEDDTCSIGIVGQFGLQWTAAGSSSWLGYRCGTSWDDFFGSLAWR
jgi:hypothetical protein